MHKTLAKHSQFCSAFPTSACRSPSITVCCACQEKSACGFTNAVQYACQNATLRLLCQSCNASLQNHARKPGPIVSHKGVHRWGGSFRLGAPPTQPQSEMPCSYFLFFRCQVGAGGPGAHLQISDISYQVVPKLSIAQATSFVNRSSCLKCCQAARTSVFSCRST